MPSGRKPTLARVHAWSGIVLALPLVVIALSGVVLLHRDALFVPGDWRAAATAAGPAEADAEIVRLWALPAAQQTEAIIVARGVRDYHTFFRPNEGGIDFWRTGAEAAALDAPSRLAFEHELLKLHEHLLAGNAGDIAVRIIGPLAAVLIVVGFVLWWPYRRGWRARDLLPRSAAAPQLLRAHLALGAALGVLVLVHAGSGAFMANNPSVRAWLKPLTHPSAAALPAQVDPSFAAGDAADAMRALRRVFPDGEITQIVPSRADETGLRWSNKLRLPGERHPNGRSNVTLDLDAGRIVSIHDARKAGVPGLYDDVMFPLHIGELFGVTQRVLWTIGALAFASLALAGAVAFLRKRRA